MRFNRLKLDCEMQQALSGFSAYSRYDLGSANRDVKRRLCGSDKKNPTMTYLKIAVSLSAHRRERQRKSD